MDRLYRLKKEESAVDEDRWPTTPRSRAPAVGRPYTPQSPAPAVGWPTTPRSRAPAVRWPNTQSPSSCRDCQLRKNRQSPSTKTPPRQSSSRRNSLNSSRKLRRDELESPLKEDENLYNQATSCLPPHRSTSSTSNVVIDSSYKSPTRQSAVASVGGNGNGLQKSVQFQYASPDYSRRTTRSPAAATSANRPSPSSLRAGTSPSPLRAAATYDSQGQALINQYTPRTTRSSAAATSANRPSPSSFRAGTSPSPLPAAVTNDSQGHALMNQYTPRTTRSPAAATSANRPSPPLRAAATNDSHGQNLINQFLGNLTSPGGPLNVSSPGFKEFAYALHQSLEDEEDIIAAEREYGSPQRLPYSDVNDSLNFAADASDRRRNRSFGTFLPPGPSAAIPSWQNNNAAAETIAHTPRRYRINGSRQRAFGSLLGNSPHPTPGTYEDQPSPDRSYRDY